MAGLAQDAVGFAVRVGNQPGRLFFRSGEGAGKAGAKPGIRWGIAFFQGPLQLVRTTGELLELVVALF